MQLLFHQQMEEELVHIQQSMWCMHAFEKRIAEKVLRSR